MTLIPFKQEESFWLHGNEPAIVSRDGAVEQDYHYWHGETGHRYLHTVYPLRECPSLPKANYILVKLDKNGNRQPLAVGQTTANADSVNLATLRQLAARIGAVEVHIHVMAEDAAERKAVEQDIYAGQFSRITQHLKRLAANH